MQRRLIVMRHAKSSWAEPSQSDHARPLNERGLEEAPAVARRLRQLGWLPEFLLSSDARRTRETWQRMARTWELTIPTEFTRSLYLAGYPELVRESACVPDEIGTLLVLGHNPGWEEVVEALCGEPIVLKTATAVLLQLPSSFCWSECLRQRGAWQLIDVIRGRDVHDQGAAD